MAGLRDGFATNPRLPSRDVHELRLRPHGRRVVFGRREASLALGPWLLVRSLDALLPRGSTHRPGRLVGGRGDLIGVASGLHLGSRAEETRPGRVGLRDELAFQVLFAAWLPTLPELRWSHAWRQRHRQGRLLPPGNIRVGPGATSCSSSGLPVIRVGSQGNAGPAARRGGVRLRGAGTGRCPSVFGCNLIGPRLRVRTTARRINWIPPRCRLAAPPCRPGRRANLRIRVDVDHPGFDQLRAAGFMGDRCNSCSGVDCLARRRSARFAGLAQPGRLLTSARLRPSHRFRGGRHGGGSAGTLRAARTLGLRRSLHPGPGWLRTSRSCRGRWLSLHCRTWLRVARAFGAQSLRERPGELAATGHCREPPHVGGRLLTGRIGLPRATASALPSARSHPARIRSTSLHARTHPRRHSDPGLQHSDRNPYPPSSGPRLQQSRRNPSPLGSGPQLRRSRQDPPPPDSGR